MEKRWFYYVYLAVRFIDILTSRREKYMVRKEIDIKCHINEQTSYFRRDRFEEELRTVDPHI